MKQIVAYLDSRAEKYLPVLHTMTPFELRDVAYASIEEVASAIDADEALVWQSFCHLGHVKFCLNCNAILDHSKWLTNACPICFKESSSAIRVFPTTGQRRKRYGSPKLPELRLEDLTSSTVANIMLKLN